MAYKNGKFPINYNNWQHRPLFTHSYLEHDAFQLPAVNYHLKKEPHINHSLIIYGPRMSCQWLVINKLTFYQECIDLNVELLDALILCRLFEDYV